MKKPIVFGAAALLGVAALAFLILPKRDASVLTTTRDGLHIEAIATPTSSVAPASAVPTAATAGGVLPISASATLDSRGQSQLQTLGEILASRNDNDPRLDTVLRGFAPATKTALTAQYQSLTPEDRNGRGTIVFLLGREISSADDLRFFSDVLNEKACLSLADCSADARAATGADTHHDSGLEVTLAYPQLVALKAIENLLQRLSREGLSPALRDAALKAIEAGKASPVPLVRRRAQELEFRVGR